MQNAHIGRPAPSARDGGRTDTFSWNIDGVDNKDNGGGGNNFVNINPDAIAEFKVLTTNYSAEYGQNAGAIINLASISAWQPGLGHAHYNSAKAAVAMHTRTAAAELGRHGIRVNAVSPGVIWREGIEQAWPEGVARYLRVVPLGRLGLPEDVADACLFLASEAARSSARRR